MMARLPDWEQRLLAWLEQCDPLPYRWGAHDCCTFAAGAVQAQTGLDFYAPFAGGYSTERGALRALKRQGFEDLFGPFDAALGARTAPLLCQRGDIVSDGKGVGVMWNRAGPCGLFVGAAPDDGAAFEIGLVIVPVAQLQWGWRLDV